MTTLSADDALKELQEGNARYLSGNTDHPHVDMARRAELKGGQEPFAVILSCADSRVPPEIVFDQGLGDLFVVRVAGNVAREKVVGSLEYAVHFLNTRLIVVMGHEACGAVRASLSPGPFVGHIGSILENIKPAVYLARTLDGDLLENSIRLNAKMVSEKLKESDPILKPAVDDGSLKIVPAHYTLDGSVRILD